MSDKNHNTMFKVINYFDFGIYGEPRYSHTNFSMSEKSGQFNIYQRSYLSTREKLKSQGEFMALDILPYRKPPILPKEARERDKTQSVLHIPNSLEEWLKR